MQRRDARLRQQFKNKWNNEIYLMNDKYLSSYFFSIYY